MAKPKMTLEMRKAMRLKPMTDHQRERRARKSKVFFAKLAERAIVAGNSAEGYRLAAVSLRKRTVQRMAHALNAIPLAA